MAPPTMDFFSGREFWKKLPLIIKNCGEPNPKSHYTKIYRQSIIKIFRTKISKATNSFTNMKYASSAGIGHQGLFLFFIKNLKFRNYQWFFSEQHSLRNHYPVDFTEIQQIRDQSFCTSATSGIKKKMSGALNR